MERLQGILGSAFALPVEPDENLPDRVMAALSREPYRPVRRLPLFTGFSMRTASSFAAAAAMVAAFAAGSRAWRVPTAPDRPSFAQAPFPRPIVPRDIRKIVKPPVGKIRRPPWKPNAAKSPQWAAAPRHPHPSDAMTQIAAAPSPPALAVPVVSREETATTPSTAAPPSPVKPAHRTAATSTEKPGNRDTAPDLSTARLRRVAGVALTRDDNTGWCNIPPDTAVRVDQRVRSGQASQVSLALGEVELRMNEETEVIPVRAPQPDAPYWVVRLINGEVFAKVPKGGYGLKVLTPAGDATSKEGEFIVKANDLFETRVLIAKGAASLENEGGKSPGLEGMQISCRIGSPPDLPQPSVDPDAFQWAYAPLRDDLPFRRNNF
jgi:hypothetical protein